MFEAIIGGPVLLIVFKLLFLSGIALYIVFAFMVVRQVQLMTQTVAIPFDPILRLIAWVHLFLAIGVFLLALVIL